MAGPGGGLLCLPDHFSVVVGRQLDADRTVSEQGSEPPRTFFHVIDAVVEHRAGIRGDAVDHSLSQPRSPPNPEKFSRLPRASSIYE